MCAWDPARLLGLYAPPPALVPPCSPPRCLSRFSPAPFHTFQLRHVQKTGEGTSSLGIPGPRQVNDATLTGPRKGRCSNKSPARLQATRLWSHSNCPAVDKHGQGISGPLGEVTSSHGSQIFKKINITEMCQRIWKGPVYWAPLCSPCRRLGQPGRLH